MNNQGNLDPTQRFTSRAGVYAQYRPDYPPEIIAALQKIIPVKRKTIIADIGSGTGIFTKLLLETRALVYAVEPNEAMRREAESLLGKTPNFRSVNGRAEATTLPDRGVDLITVAQAFHWFRPEATLREFARILRQTGLVVLIWNARFRVGDPFAAAYEALLHTFCPEYHPAAQMEYAEDRLREALGPIEYTLLSFPNSQVLDLDGLKGRLLSASYAPTPSSPSFLPMISTLETMFQEFQQGGYVTMRYETKLYYFRLVA